MIVLQEIGTAQDFKVIPRAYLADRMEITGETTRKTVSYDITASVTGYYLTWSKIVDLKQDNFYTLTVYNGADVVYKDKIFCTNQAVSTFSVNNNEFTSVATNNEYITL
jgi:hypothetical protein